MTELCNPTLWDGTASPQRKLISCLYVQFLLLSVTHNHRWGQDVTWSVTSCYWCWSVIQQLFFSYSAQTDEVFPFLPELCQSIFQSPAHLFPHKILRYLNGPTWGSNSPLHPFLAQNHGLRVGVTNSHFHSFTLALHTLHLTTAPMWAWGHWLMKPKEPYYTLHAKAERWSWGHRQDSPPFGNDYKFFPWKQWTDQRQKGIPESNCAWVSLTDGNAGHSCTGNERGLTPHTP